MRNSIGSLTPYNPGKSIEELEKDIGKKVYNLSANESPWGPSPNVKDYLYHQVLKINHYPDGAANDLKKALAEYWNLSVNNFCLGNGADDLITMISQALLNPNEEVIIPTPTFSEYATSVTICGGICTLLPQKDLYIKLNEIIEGTSKNTKMIFLCNPNNPTGTCFSHNELIKLMENIPKETIVVLDEAYCHYVMDKNFPRSDELVKKYENIIVLRTFSKAYGLAGLRVGYAVGPDKLIKLLEKVRQPFNVNRIAQKAALIGIKDDEYLHQVIRETVKERTWLMERLDELGIEYLPSQANFVFMNIKRDASELVEKLKREGILVRHAASFGYNNWMRVSFSKHEIMELFINKLSEFYNNIY